MEESPRIKNLRNKIICEIPFFPNTKETQEELISKPFEEVLLAYLNWKSRIIPIRHRKTTLPASVTTHKKWCTYKESIRSILKKADLGMDLNPFLSEKVNKRGYESDKLFNKENIWNDKDQILNLHHYHHFHLDMNIKDNLMSERSEYLLFAEITRNKFTAIGIFDHSIFDEVLPNYISSERKRFLDIHYQRVIKHSSSQFVTSSQITASGHNYQILKSCHEIIRILFINDSKLDQRNDVNSIYANFKRTPPPNFKFEWYFDGLDLYLRNKKTDDNFLFYKGYL